MAEKLTLEEAWTKCLAMWKWVAEQDCNTHPSHLKMQWLKANTTEKAPVNECYFCEYSTDDGINPNCGNCPMGLGTYGCEGDVAWHWIRHPKAFYAKILELNKIRTEGNNG